MTTPCEAPERDTAFQKFKAALLADERLSLVLGETGEPVAEVLREGAASLRLKVSGGLLHARYVGPIAASFLELAQARGEDSRAHDAMGVLVDFTSATVAFSFDQLHAVMAASRIGVAMRPRALVVRPDQATMFRTFAVRFALEHPVSQRVFFDCESAASWALASARLNQ